LFAVAAFDTSATFAPLAAHRATVFRDKAEIKSGRSVRCVYAPIQFWAWSASSTYDERKFGQFATPNTTCSSKFIMNERYGTLISKV
jgi:hypothetical protein